MAKRSQDIGLKYMISLGISPAKSKGGVEEQLLAASDPATVREILSLFSERGDTRTDDDETFYPAKNKTLKLSLAISSAFDGDILRKACNWIEKNKDLFGNSILEVGCDCGIMTCFLAKMFPQAQITAIDRCQEGINNAMQLAKQMAVNNVRFICIDVKEISEQFDTVFSMRTVHENHIMKYEDDPLKELDEQASFFQASLCSYAQALSSKVSEEGLLISIERIGRNPLLLGWMKALEQSGFTFYLERYEELKCSEVGKESVFEAFVSYKTNEETVDARELFMYACSKYMDFSHARYTGWEAKIIFDWKHGELIEGYLVEDKNTHAKCNTTIWTHKFDETSVLLYQNNNGNVFIENYDISQKDEIIKMLENSIEETSRNDNCLIRKI